MDDREGGNARGFGAQHGLTERTGEPTRSDSLLAFFEYPKGLARQNRDLPGGHGSAVMTFMTSRAVAWSIRAFFFAVVGVLTFFIQPPGATAENAQLVAYVLAGLGLLAWALADMWPAAARYRARALPVILGVIAVAGGFACTAGSNENNCPVMLASMATTGAGSVRQVHSVIGASPSPLPPASGWMKSA